MAEDPRLPLFPLRTVLYPGGVLPLQIFEVRYLDMIGRCHREGRPFGIVCLTEGHEVQRPGGAPSGDAFAVEAFHDVGTLAHITRLERPRPGLFTVRLRGGQRFRLTSRQRLPHGLWVGDTEPIADDADVPLPEDLAATSRGLEQVLDDFRVQGLADEDLPLQPPWRFGDCGWVANRWCELLPLDAATRQQLLVVESPLLRLELVTDTLDRLEAKGGA